MNADDAVRRQYPDRLPLPMQPYWVRDFPTDVPDDELVARRAFIRFLVLTSGAFATGQCWIALMGRESGGPGPRQRIASLAELQAKRVIEFRYPTTDDPCLLIWIGANRIVAYGQKCPHLACAVVPDLGRSELVCPCHNGHFEIEAGRPVAGPARRPLPRIQIEVDSDSIFAIGVGLRTE